MKTWIIVVMFFAVIAVHANAQTQWEVKNTANSTDYSYQGCSVSVRNDGLGLTLKYTILGVVTDTIVSTKKDGKEYVQEKKLKEVAVDRVVYFPTSFIGNCHDAIPSLPAPVLQLLNTPEMLKHLLWKQAVVVTSQKP